MYTNKFVSLKRKLVFSNLVLIFLAIATFSSSIVYSIKNLSSRFSIMNVERSEDVKKSYKNTSEENIRKIKSIYELQLKRKAEGLLSKDSTSLSPMIADNAFLSVQNFLQKTFEDDRDIVLASYFVLDQGEIKAWHYVSDEYREGLASPVIYDQKLKGWKGKTKRGKSVFISDPSIMTLVESNFRKIEFNNQTKSKLLGFDCIIPFYEGKTGEFVKSARAKGETIGFLRYILSPAEMLKAIEEEEKTLEDKLKVLETENQTSLVKTQEIAGQEINKVFLVLFLAALIIVIIGYAGSLVSANKIAKPIKELTLIAESMSKGNYKQNINLISNDEIGILAQSFQEMSNAILKRDADLAEINGNLEKIVEERTATINTILNNVKCGFLLVSADKNIQEGYTKYCNTLFGDKVAVGVPLSQVLGLNKRNSDNFEVLIEQVFEDILDEDFNISQIPKKYFVDDKVLHMTGSAIRNANKNVSSILFTVNDATDLERVERENSNNRTLLKLLQQKEAFQSFVNDVKAGIQTAREMIKNQNQNSVRGILHTLKGNMSLFGLAENAKNIHLIEDSPHIEMKHLQIIENEFINFLQTYSSVLSVSYDGISEEVYELKKSKLDSLAEAVGSIKSENEKLAYVYKWIQYVQQRKAVDLLGTIPEYTVKLAERLNKKVVLQLEGGDVLVESKILKPFFQVLPHFIRNSIDHGIEPVSERGSKNETGVIKIAFSEDKSHWFVEISDDGKGINLDKLVKKALDLKVVSEGQLRKMSNEEKFNLIFLDGVSSADQVSDISGRGVGMSAVADVIHGIGGEIKIRSELGVGTSIICSISKEGGNSRKIAEKVAA